MKKILLSSLPLLMIPLSAFADNVGGCGWGSKLFDGKKGTGSQVLAVTTNGTSGNQTFGISSGTSGCTQDGVVQSNWKTAMFIDSNSTMLARDMSAGNGESLESLASLMGVSPEHKELFFQAVRANFDAIFPRQDVSSKEIALGLHNVLAKDAVLSVYSQTV